VLETDFGARARFPGFSGEGKANHRDSPELAGEGRIRGRFLGMGRGRSWGRGRGGETTTTDSTRTPPCDITRAKKISVEN